MNISAFFIAKILTQDFAAGLIGNFVASIGYDASKAGIGKLNQDLKSVLFDQSDENHDLMRAALYAQCRALVAVCDACLAEDFQLEYSAWQAFKTELGLPASRDEAISVILHIRHNVHRQSLAVPKLSIPELEALVATELDAETLMQRGKAIDDSQGDKTALSRISAQHVLNVLEFSADNRGWWQGLLGAEVYSIARQPQIPAQLRARIERHWFDLVRSAFREALKSEQFSQARYAFQHRVLAKLSGVPLQLEAIEAKLDEQDQKLEAVYLLLVNLNKKLNVWRAEGNPAEAERDYAEWQNEFKAKFNEWQEQLKRIETNTEHAAAQAQAAAESSAEAVTEVRALRRDLAQGGVVLTRVSPSDWTAYHRERVAEWSQPQFDLQRRFVRLTLQFTHRDEARGNETRPDPDNRTYQGLDELLAARPEFPVLVVLGDPGCGKSTLLRHLQWWHSTQRLTDDTPEISWLISLNTYDGAKWRSPREWLAEQWAARYPQLPALAEVLQSRNVLLLLDALNEMKPRERLSEMIGEWRALAQELVRGRRHQLVFTCREDDYEELLDCADDYDVPQVLAQRLTDEQMNKFIAHYAAPAYVALIQQRLDEDDRLREFYRNTFFLKLLCDIVNSREGEFPQGRASLFTHYVWDLLERECDKHPNWLTASGLLTVTDHKLLAQLRRKKRPPFALPENGLLLPKLRELAFGMQQKGGDVTLSGTETCALLNDETRAHEILLAGRSLTLLDEMLGEDFTFHYKFFHQLLQEYFAARQFARTPDWTLVQQDWSAENLRAEYEALTKGAALPALPQSHWFETTIIAAPMAAQPNEFIRQLKAVNPVLAARCANSAEVQLDGALKAELQTTLQAMLLDQSIDVRARIQAGEQLGLLGDPRFTRHAGKEGDYLLPPFVPIPADTYTIGWRKSQYTNEQHEAKVKLAAFEIAAFPVTNAEYRCFIEANGYGDERWWDTPAALDFLRTGAVGPRKEGWWQDRKCLQDNRWTEAHLIELGKERGWSKSEVEVYVKALTLSDDEFAAELDEWFAEVEPPTSPSFWEEAPFNSPAQPVAGVSWYEALAYGNWLTATVNDGRVFGLPTEAQFEAAARRKTTRLYPYGNAFDRVCANTSESRIRRTTPVGVFNNAPTEDAPQGIYDLSGNVWTWTLSLYDEKNYDPFAGRDNLLKTGNRVLRGGSWVSNVVDSRAASRNHVHPADRDFFIGVRLVSMRPPS